MRHKVIISISSDIGYHLAKDWLQKGIKVIGTFRKNSVACDNLRKQGAILIESDLASETSVRESIKKIASYGKWESLVIASGCLDPIGKFIDTDFDSWSESLKINFTSQMRYIHGLLPYRALELKHPPSVLMFAGGGTNNATIDFSAYTIAKIASIKMVELLDAEISDTAFTILGPGWVNTKIHETTLASKNKSSINYIKTLEMIENAEEKCYPMNKVVDCCNWILTSSRQLVGGRNFSAVHDPWEEDQINLITKDSNIFKLRRFGNSNFSLNDEA